MRQYPGSVFRARSVAALAIAGAILGAASARAADDVHVRFSWKLKGEYAPFYLAEAKGFYADKGLKVTMGEGAGSQAALGALLQGQEDVVVMPGIFAISAIQKGMPVKIIALYHPKTPVVIISYPEKPIVEPKDLEGKTVAHSVGETGTSYLSVFCAVNHVDCSKVKKVMVNAQARVAQFLQGQVDAVSVYRSNDLPIIQKQTGSKFPVLDLAAHGLAAPGLSVVSSDAIIKEEPDVLKRFLAAVDQGIKATEADPAAAAAALKKVWPAGPPVDVITEQVKATVDALRVEEGKPIGWTDPKDVEAALELLRSEENFGEAKPIDAFYTNALLK